MINSSLIGAINKDYILRKFTADKIHCYIYKGILFNIERYKTPQLLHKTTSYLFTQDVWRIDVIWGRAIIPINQ